jgi:hypothetical protein
MTIPSWFSSALRAEFDNRLRVRWSDSQQQFLIEQKVGRQRAPKRRIDPLDDRAIQLRDGYAFVLGVTPGDRTSCPRCHRGTHVPVMRMKFATCEHCNKEFRACYWPLSDGLLQWLRWSDPYRDGLQRMERDLLDHEAGQAVAKRRALSNDLENITKDEFTRLFDIQSVGYTGREKAWEH